MTRPTDVETPYTLASIQEMLGISRAVVTSLVKAGFVTPSRGARNEYRFGFRDVVLLRTAYGLQAANMSHRRIVRALERLRATLPDALPLSGLRVTAVGNDIAVRDGAHHVAAESGQLLLDFEVAPVRGAVAFLQSTAPAAPLPQSDELGDDAGAWFARAEAAEANDPAAAEAAYRRAIQIAPCYADAYLNLGALLHDQGRFADATRLYDNAIVRCPDAALLHFNRALALEDEGRVDAAIASYERAVALAPDLADAHFNAARLYERSGDTKKALRHFNAYRRLQR